MVFNGSIYDIIGWVPTDVKTWNCQPKLGNWCCESSKHELFPPRFRISAPSRGHLVKSEEVKIAGGFVDPFLVRLVAVPYETWLGLPKNWRWLENQRVPTWKWKIRWFEMLNWGNVHCYLWLRVVGRLLQEVNCFPRSWKDHQLVTHSHGNALCCTCKNHQKAWKNRNFELQDIHFKTPGSSISKQFFRAFSRKMMNHWIIVHYIYCWIRCFGFLVCSLHFCQTNLRIPPRLSISAKQRRSRDNVSWDQFWWSTDYVFLAKENNVWKIVEKMTHLYMILEILYDSFDDCCFFRWKIPQFQNCCSSSLRK